MIVTTSDLDLLKLAAFIAAFFINRQALALIAAHLAWELIYISTDSGFAVSLLSSALYFIVAASNINLKSEIRHAIWLLGCLYWLAALDYYVADTVTYFYIIFPWLINMVDAYIIYHLMGGGRAIVGITSGLRSIVNSRRIRL